jgi:hydroxycarboxylate dehydrogenase B
MEDVRLSPEQWRGICEKVIGAWGAPTDIAACVANSFVESNLCGVDSHGVVRIVNYWRFVKSRWWLAEARPAVARESACTAVVDGRWGLGQPAMHMGLDLGIAKARQTGIAGIGVIQCGHIGRLGEYADKAARQGMVAMLGTSNAIHGGHVAPFGGAERVFSTNPIAAAVPARGHAPFLMDFATTVVAAGKLELGADPDMPIPEGWAMNASGGPARTAREYVDGGAQLPFGGHKGYALMLLVELLAGALTGAGVTQRPATVPTGQLGWAGNSTFLVVLDPGVFTDKDRFLSDVDGLFARLDGVKPAAGFKRVVVPGEPEVEQRERRLRDGFPIPRVIWDQIAAVAAECGADLAGMGPER